MAVDNSDVVLANLDFIGRALPIEDTLSVVGLRL